MNDWHHTGWWGQSFFLAIGDAEQWTKIVQNLGALVRDLDRTFVPHIERAAGPSPECYVPDR